MTSKLIARCALIPFLWTVFTATLSAEHVEIYPNAGFVWPRHMANGQNFKDQAIWGVKGGVFLNSNMQIEGSFEYLNHFQLREPPNPFDPVFGVVQLAVRGFLYDANLTYNFGERQFAGEHITPFLAAGAGGLRQIHFRRAAVGVRPGNFAGGGWNDFKRRQRPGLSSSWRRHAQKRRNAGFRSALCQRGRCIIVAGGLGSPFRYYGRRGSVPVRKGRAFLLRWTPHDLVSLAQVLICGSSKTCL